MDRRLFLKGSSVGLGTAAAFTMNVAPMVAQSKKKLTMVTTSWRGLEGVFDAAQRVADNINSMSNGSLEVEVKAAGELMGAYEVFDAVSSGVADIYHGADYYFIGKHPGFMFFTGVPFGMTATEHNIWWYHMGGRELGNELGELFNLKTFVAGNTTSQAGGWYHLPIRNPSDLNGLKVRILGLGGEILKKLGVSIQSISGADVYKSFSLKEIDGVQWIGPWADEKVGFHRIAKYYYAAGFHEPNVAFSCAINRDVFNNLTLSEQKIIELACAEANIWNMSQHSAYNGMALQRLVATGVIVSQFPDSVWEAIGDATKDFFEEYNQDELFEKIYHSYFDSMNKITGWSSESVTVYQSQRNRILNL